MDLWREVLLQAASDLVGAERRTLEEGETPETTRQDVLDWLGTDDFHEVCALAGLDPERVEDQFRRFGGR